MKIFQKIIFWLFGILLFLVPLILWPFTSEVFEFNKMVLVYLMTVLITGTWVINMIVEKKFIFRRTILDIPLLVFLGSQLFSTLLSIDPGTSWFGYYSRFNGGMFSIISYCLLYWGFVTYFDAKRAIKLIYVTLVSATIVSAYGVMEHFGIDKKIWVQDVQSRIFSTLGQPNWLASWLIGLIPIVWAFMLNTKQNLKSKSFWVYFSLSVLLFWTLIFTKSRSGIVGFGVMYLVFWIGYFWTNKSELKKYLIPFIIISSSLFIICLISGTHFTPSIGKIFSKSTSTQAPVVPSGGTALETGGTESSAIRKIVWKGAVQVWLHYPIFGTGVETFAYSYYLYRPAEHNSTSEWDFIYNKAHNEYLNFAANSGTVGILAYLGLIGFSIFLILKLKNQNPEFNNIPNLKFALLAGYASLLFTNFFGFSVVPTQLEFFLFPAIALAFTKNEEVKAKRENLSVSNTPKAAVGTVLLFASYLIFLTCRYWYADYLYASGKGYNSINKPDIATKYLVRAINLEPNQPLYHSEVSSSYARIAVAFNQQKQVDQVTQFSNLAIAEINKAVDLSPANINLKRTRFGVFIMLSAIDPKFFIDARDTLITATAQAPTDAKLYYNLGLVYARIGQPDQASETLKKTIDLKPDYREARLAYAYLLIDKKQYAEARTQLEYILTNIDPTSSLAKQALESIK
ncbi:MAG: O-antigen ligase family protein [Candidatus Woesebacteria bacterium]|nr:O-antigen ligase family protein [Candidatus Woesebacteria bacterium]